MVDGSCCAITVADLLDRFSCGVDERQRMCVAIADDVRIHAAQPPAIEELSTCQLAMQHSLCISRVGRSVWQPTRLQLYKLGRHDLLLLLLLLVMNRLLPLLRILHNKNHPKVPRELPFWQRWSHPSCSPESRDSFCKRLVASATHESRKNIEFNHHTKNIEIV